MIEEHVDAAMDEAERYATTIVRNCIVARNRAIDAKLERELREFNTTREESPGLVIEAEEKKAKRFTGNCSCVGCRAFRDANGIMQPPAPEKMCTKCLIRDSVRIPVAGHVCPHAKGVTAVVR